MIDNPEAAFYAYMRAFDVDTIGEEIARLGFTYTMRHVGSWRIIVAALHEPNSA